MDEPAMTDAEQAQAEWNRRLNAKAAELEAAFRRQQEVSRETALEAARVEKELHELARAAPCCAGTGIADAVPCVAPDCPVDAADIAAATVAFETAEKGVTSPPTDPADLADWAQAIIANGITLADGHIDPDAGVRAAADAGITIERGGWAPEAARWKTAAEKWLAAYQGDPRWELDGEADEALLAALGRAVSVTVVGPAGLQRNIAVWLHDAGHHDAATALAEADMQALLEV